MRSLLFTLVCVVFLNLASAAESEPAKPSAAEIAVRQSSDAWVKAFNAGKVNDLVAMFVAEGEIIDEQGTQVQGHAAIEKLLAAFFEKFPGTKLGVASESVRVVGPVAIEEGGRTMSSKDGTTSQFRFIAVRSLTADGWKLVSIRDISDAPAPTPKDMLQPLSWMVGEWLNEGSDGKVSIAYRWSDDGNYLLGEFNIIKADGSVTKSTQRIGWDPRSQKLHSWLFDDDGGFAEGIWTELENEWNVKSCTVNADGTTASATITLVPVDRDHFRLKGSDRIVGDARESDFQFTVARRPPGALDK